MLLGKGSTLPNHVASSQGLSHIAQSHLRVTLARPAGQRAAAAPRWWLNLVWLQVGLGPALIPQIQLQKSRPFGAPLEQVRKQ